MREQYAKLLQKVNSVAGDVEKAADGNKSATTRVRLAMQEVKTLAQDVRLASKPAW